MQFGNGIFKKKDFDKIDRIMNLRDEIMGMVSQPEILAQMAEEAAELGKACLKLRRAITKDNPTPVSEEEAVKQLAEEWSDLMLCKDALDKAYRPEPGAMIEIMERKAARWVERLREGKRE